jgi:hypothetical protein
MLSWMRGRATFWVAIVLGSLSSCSSPQGVDYLKSAKLETMALDEPISGTYRLRIVSSAKCLDLSDAADETADGVRVVQKECTNKKSQHWRFLDLGNGVHQLQAAHSGKCLDTSAPNAELPGAERAQQWDCRSREQQRFSLLAHGNGQYSLRSSDSGKCLDVEGGSGASDDDSPIIEWPCHSGHAQRILLEPIGNSPPPPGQRFTVGQWRKANLTWYESYPDPGSEECTKYNGCQWAGLFAGLNGRQTEAWVASHNIAAVHGKDFAQYRSKTLRLRQGSREIDVTVYDMCADSDCDGCCTKNSRQTGFLIDIEKYTAARFGARSGIVEWTCLDC